LPPDSRRNVRVHDFARVEGMFPPCKRPERAVHICDLRTSRETSDGASSGFCGFRTACVRRNRDGWHWVAIHNDETRPLHRFHISVSGHLGLPASREIDRGRMALTRHRTRRARQRPATTLRTTRRHQSVHPIDAREGLCSLEPFERGRLRECHVTDTTFGSSVSSLASLA